MTLQTKIGNIVENADIDRETPQPQIHVEERRLTLLDFLRTCIKINGSDVHLQAGSTPMIRVDGRPRFLDSPAPSDEQMKQYVDQIVSDPVKLETLRNKGSVDVAYAMPDKTARFRTSIFHSRERYAIVMRRIVTKIPRFDELNLPPQIEKLSRISPMRIVSGSCSIIARRAYS